MKLERKRVVAITIMVIVIIVVGGIWYDGTHARPSLAAGKSPDASSSTSTVIGSGSGAANSKNADNIHAVVNDDTIVHAQASTASAVGPVIDAASLTQNTNGWGTCENVQYGYELKYPLQWMQFQYDGVNWSQESPVNCAGEQQVTLSANDPLVEKITIAVYPANATSGIPALNSTAAEPGMSWQETAIDGEDALWNSVIDVADNTRTDSVDIRHDGRLYVLTYWFCTATTYVNLSEINFQTMAENLKFL